MNILDISDSRDIRKQCCDFLGTRGYRLESIRAGDVEHAEETLAYY